MITISILIALSALTACQSTEPLQHSQNNRLLKAYPTNILANEIIKLEPIKGHQFNLESPNSCVDGKLIELTKEKIECQFSSGGKKKIRIGICDDKKTFCKLSFESINVEGPIASNETQKQEFKEDPNNFKVSKEGFIENNFSAALSKSAKSKHLILADFYAEWCPPCNDLDDFVFPTKEFQKYSQNWTKVKINVETATSWKWKEKYKITSYPTVLILNHKGEEIGRLIGSRSLESFLNWMKEERTNRFQPLNLLSIRSSIKNRKRLAKWKSQIRKHKEAHKITQSIEGFKDSAEAFTREVSLHKENEAKYIKVLKEGLRKFPNSAYFSSWALSLSEKDSKAAKKFITKAYKSVDTWSKNSKAENFGYEESDFYFIGAEIAESQKDDAKAKLYYQKAASQLKSMLDKAHSPIARGKSVALAYCYKKLGQKEKALKLYKRLADTYPNGYHYLERYARELYKAEKYSEAWEYSQKAEKHAYDNLKLKLAHTQAKILIALKKKSQAKKVIESAITKARVSSWKRDGSQYSLRKLRKLKKSL